MMYNERIETVAIRAIMKQEGVEREQIDHADCGYPELTSAVTATFHVRVFLKGGASSYEVPVATRVDYTHPVATDA